jgi:hypothetical protein
MLVASRTTASHNDVPARALLTPHGHLPLPAIGPPRVPLHLRKNRGTTQGPLLLALDAHGRAAASTNDDAAVHLASSTLTGVRCPAAARHGRAGSAAQPDATPAALTLTLDAALILHAKPLLILTMTFSLATLITSFLLPRRFPPPLPFPLRGREDDARFTHICVRRAHRIHPLLFAPRVTCLAPIAQRCKALGCASRACQLVRLHRESRSCLFPLLHRL